MTRHTKIWRIPKPNPVLQEIFAGSLGISRTVAQILINRGITTLEQARAFFSPEGSLLHAPELMKDMTTAVARIKQAVGRDEKIRIFGDYDADGITSTAILVRVLKRLGARVDYYIPERLTEGYGMNREAVEAAGQDGISLIITVDSGISSVEEVALAGSLGLDVIITDHHEPPEVIPQALAVINPKQGDCPYPFKDLAGAGVAFKLAQALTGSDAPLAEDLAELACLGTIADIVPLQGENRVMVRQGLQCFGNTGSPGIQALIYNCGIKGREISSRQIAFQVAPRINAAGRLGDASVALRLLLCEDPEEADRLAAGLCALNEERQGIEAGIYKEAVSIIESGGVDLNTEKVIVIAREGWHLGVLGIVASKLVQDYYRPVLLLSVDGKTAKGSARSIPAFNLFEGIKAQAQYLDKYGGHKQAAGLTLAVDKLPQFRAAINEYAAGMLGEQDLLPEVYIDAEVEINELNENLHRQLEMLAPFGCENPGPTLACRRAAVVDYRNVGTDGSHLKLRVRDRQTVFDAIGFYLGAQGTVLSREDSFDLVFALEKNEWNGRTSLQLNVKDFKPSSYADNPFAAGRPEPSGFVAELFKDAVTYLTDDFYRDIADKEEFYTKVAGVTFDNRQETVASLTDGEKLVLMREPANAYDSNAVQVITEAGCQIGYLNARLAKHFAPLLDRGEQYQVYVSQVTGGQDRNYGLNIVIQKLRAEDLAEHRKMQDDRRQELAGLSDDELFEKIRAAVLGGNAYREKQREALEHLAKGHNTLAIFGTGRGKSAVFQSMAAFKALRNREMTVVIYPLRALVNDQYENMTARLSGLGLRVYKGNGSISAMERVLLFEAMAKGEIDILLTTPEFMAHHTRKLQAAHRRVGLFVVDESHHIGMSSQAHRPLYKRLGELAADLGRPVVLAVTATANDQVAAEIMATLDIESVVIDPHVRTNLRIVDKRDWPDKHSYLKNLVRTGGKTIIYVNSRLQSLELASMLREALPEMADRTVFYHAGLTSEHRNTIEKMFRTGEVTTVVSTSAFGEGIDIPDVKNVVVFHLNFNFTEFNQQCGRCGRDGEEALIHLLCGRRDSALNQFILETSAPDRENLAKLYMVLKEAAGDNQPITMSNDELAQKLRLAGCRSARPNMVSAGLGILEELNLIQRETMGRERKIQLQPWPGEKLELESSVRYIEGQEEKQAFQQFQQYFFQAADNELLSLVNSPIYPQQTPESVPRDSANS